MSPPTGINLALDPATQSGLTVTAKVIAAGSVVATYAVPEVGAGTAIYYLPQSSITGLAAGAYVVSCYAAGSLVGGPDVLLWSGTAEVDEVAAAITATPIAGLSIQAQHDARDALRLPASNGASGKTNDSVAAVGDLAAAITGTPANLAAGLARIVQTTSPTVVIPNPFRT